MKTFTAISWLLLSLPLVGRADGLDQWTFRGPLPGELLAITYGGGQFVAVGYSGRIVTSPGGDLWLSSPKSGTTNTLQSVAYGNGRFVAVGSDGSVDGSSTVATSADGITWTSSLLGTNTWLSSVAFVNDRFMAMGWESTNGTNWSQNELPFGLHPVSVAYGNGRYVAVGSHSCCYGSVLNIQVLTSQDGMAWSEPSLGTNDLSGSLEGVAFGNGVFVAVGGQEIDAPSSASYRLTLTSHDGLSWTIRRDEGQLPLGQITYAAGQFVAIGDTIQTSADGVNWTQRNWGNGDILSNIAYGNGHFIAVGGSGLYESNPIIRLTWGVYRSNPSPALFLEGPVGLDCTIQWSSDLTMWHNVTKVTASQLTKVNVEGLPTISGLGFYRSSSP